MNEEDSRRLRDVEGHIVEIKTMLDPVCRKVTEQDRFINGYNGTPGAKTRFDRLEQEAQQRRWITRLISVPVLGLIVKWVWDHWPT